MAAKDSKDRYELVSTLGKGGMAEVFLGWMNSVGGLRRKVAIKRILPDLAQKQSKLFEKMFVDEARLAFQLEHDNIVRVYDVGQSANTFFIVMEFVEGPDLKRVFEELRKSNRHMSLSAALYIGTQVAAGLAYAHAMEDDEGQTLGLVHNDISPPNILLGRYGEVKVADFGLSDAVSNDVVTPEGMVKGKFAYISPESTRDPTLVSLKSDIFSVGIVLWELIAGERLFQRDTDLDTFTAVRDAVIPDIRQYRPDIPEDIVAILHTALHPDPEQRYADCEELYADIVTASYRNAIRLDRGEVVTMVKEIAGAEFGRFKGERVSDNIIAQLKNELEEMLPPGVEAHLSTFVTGASVAEDVDDIQVEGDWVADVFDDVGFDDDDELGFGGPEPQEQEEQAAHALSKTSPAPKASPPPSSVSPARVTPSRTSPMPSHHSPLPELKARSSAPGLKTARQQSQPQVPSELIESMKQEFQSQKFTFVIWGLVGGLVLGTLAGLAIGMLL